MTGKREALCHPPCAQRPRPDSAERGWVLHAQGAAVNRNDPGAQAGAGGEGEGRVDELLWVGPPRPQPTPIPRGREGRDSSLPHTGTTGGGRKRRSSALEQPATKAATGKRPCAFIWGCKAPREGSDTTRTRGAGLWGWESRRGGKAQKWRERGGEGEDGRREGEGRHPTWSRPSPP